MRYGRLRTRNPGIGETPLNGLFLNPFRPRPRPKPKRKPKPRPKPKPKKAHNPKGAKPMAKRRKKRTPPRDPRTGYFMKKGAKAKKRKKSNPRTYAYNPVQYAVATNPPKKRRKRRNPVTYSGSPGRYVQAPNPRRRAGIRKYNPNSKGMNKIGSLGDLVKPGLAALGGFMAPGLAWEILGQNGRTAVTGWFTKSKNPDAWGRFTVGAITTGAIWFASNRIQFLEEVQLPLMTGALMRNAHDLGDAILDTTPGTMGARLRRILALPTAAQITAAGATGVTGQQAGMFQDPVTGQWKQSIQAGVQDPQDASMYPVGAQGDKMEMINQGITEAGIVPPGDGVAPVAGMQGASHPIDPGMGEMFVKRELVEKNSNQRGVGEMFVKRELVDAQGRYRGMGATFVDQAQTRVFLEPGQRYPARVRSRI